MRFTGHLLGDGVVQVVRLALHHGQDILLADKDDEDPNSLKRSSLVKAAAASFDPGYLAHVQGVSEDHPTRIGLKSSEGEVEDLKVPGDAHPKEEPDVDQHLVPFDADLAAASAVRARTTKQLIEKGEVYSLGLANVHHNVDEHAGVDEQKNKDWKVKPKKFAHTTIKVTATEKEGFIIL